MATTAQAKRALQLFESELAGRKNVVGLGIVPAEGTGNSARHMAVAVYVTKKLPPTKLRPSDLVPKELVLPGRSSKVTVPTRVIDAGGGFEIEAAASEAL